jgi:hypothetical protein
VCRIHGFASDEMIARFDCMEEKAASAQIVA